MRILVIEDEEKLSSFLKIVLESEKNLVTVVDSIEEVFKNGYELSHDLIILDLMLAGKPGDELMAELKKRNVEVPVMVLSALNQIAKKVELLNLGADDYMTKPFDSQELLARIQSIHRRTIDIKKQDFIEVGNMSFYRKQNKVIREGKEIFLTPKESELLLFLIQKQGQLVKSEDILNKVWNKKAGFHSNILQATVKRLRQKIDQNFEERYISNVHGVGYLFKVDQE